MAKQLTVYNIASGGSIVHLSNDKIASGASRSYDRKQVVMGRYAPEDSYEASLYRDLLAMISEASPVIRVLYDGITLTATTLALLQDTDAEADDSIHEWTISFNDGGAANAYVAYWICPHALRVTEVTYSAAVAVTAHDTNYATLSIFDRTGTKTVAQQTTKITGGSGNVAQYANTNLTLSTTAADLDLAADDFLEFDLAKAAAGVAVAGELKVSYKMLVG